MYYSRFSPDDRIFDKLSSTLDKAENKLDETERYISKHKKHFGAMEDMLLNMVYKGMEDVKRLRSLTNKFSR